MVYQHAGCGFFCEPVKINTNSAQDIKQEWGSTMHLCKNLVKCLFMLLLCAGFYGCAVQPPRKPSMATVESSAVTQRIESEKKAAPESKSSEPEDMAPIETNDLLNQQKFSMVFNNAPLAEVIQAITRETPYNLSVEREIDLHRPVTIRLKDVGFKDAMNMIVEKAAGYAWHIEDNNLYIRQFEDRIYHFDYLDMAGETEIEVGGDMLASGVENSGVSGKYQMKTTRSAEITDVWAGLAASLQEIKSEGGSVRVNRNAGVIYMTDTPKKIDGMVEFLDSLLDSLQRQVYIEAKIMEVQLSDSQKYGIDWTKFNLQFTSSSGALPEALDLSVNGGGTFVLSNQSGYSGVLDYLQTQGDVSVISNPHITVMNGKSAILTVGIQFPYGDIDGVDRDTETGLITYGTSIKRAILGLQLGITPQISKDGIVTLNIVPTITRIQSTEQVELPTSGTSKQSISNPIIELQELSTTVRVRGGNSIVLAGLISQIKNNAAEGLPGFNRMPLVGAMFNHMEKVLESRELVIFITPYVKKII